MLISLLFYSGYLLSTVTAGSCYWPNGNSDSHFKPCPNSKTCCLEGEACISNGLCYAGKLSTVYRGACTDESWPIAECPRICYEAIPDSWANLYSCPGDPTNNFTCGVSAWATDVCNEKKGYYIWVAGNVTIAQNGMSSGAPSTPNITRSSSVRAGDSVPTSSGISPGTSIPSDSSSASPVALGAGLGVGLGVPLLFMTAVMIFMCVRDRRQRRVDMNMTGEVIEEEKKPPGGPAQNLSAFEVHSDNPIRELDGLGRAEMPG